MSKVDFYEDNDNFHIKSRRLLGEPETPTMIRVLLKVGLAKNEKQALLILIGVLVFLIAVALYLFSSINSNPEMYVYDKMGKQYTIEEQLQAIKSGTRTFDDFK